MSPPAALQIAEQQYDSPFIGESLDLMIDALSSGLIYIDTTLRIQHCNRRCADWLGDSAAALRGRHAATALGAQGWRHFEPHLRRALNGEHSTREHVLSTPDHGDLTFATTCIPDRDARGEVRGLFALLADVTARTPDARVALHVAPHDQAPEVPGPQHLADQLCEALEARRGDGQRMALLWFSFDGIGPAAGALGKPLRDLLVPDIALRIMSFVRSSDVVARVDSDEIAVLLPCVAQSSDATRVADKIQTVCRQPVEVDGSRLRPRSAVGIAIYPDHAANAAGILAAAEADLARAAALI